jgi:hypothetical protein
VYITGDVSVADFAAIEAQRLPQKEDDDSHATPPGAATAAPSASGACL